MNVLKMFWVTALSMLISLSVQAQEYAHVNSGNLLEMLPEVKNADAELVKLQQKLLTERDQKVSAFQEIYQKAIEAFNSGDLSPKEQQEKEAALRKEQEAISKFEQNIQNQVVQKRQELLGPILEKVDEAIQAVAKEKGFTMVFDTAQGGLLFAAETQDITDLVKAKLGL
jgi:outer membrane protein